VEPLMCANLSGKRGFFTRAAREPV
jgi:hypothetical protein